MLCISQEIAARGFCLCSFVFCDTFEIIKKNPIQIKKDSLKKSRRVKKLPPAQLYSHPNENSDASAKLQFLVAITVAKFCNKSREFA